MATLSTTKMSSKGQVVIPEEIRNELGLKIGSSFVVLGNRDCVILKKIEAPSQKELNELIKQSRIQARKAGMKKKDVKDAIKLVRGK